MELLNLIWRRHYRDRLSTVRYLAHGAVAKHGPYPHSDIVEPKFDIPDWPSRLDPTPASCRTCCDKRRQVAQAEATIKRLHTDLISAEIDTAIKQSFSTQFVDISRPASRKDSN